MFINILKRIFLFIFLPNGLFFYSCYFNDLFSVDLFNLKKINNLDLKIQELRNSIENNSNISKNIDKNVSNSNNILIYIVTGCFIAGFFYLGYNFFNNNDSADVGKIVVENASLNSQSLVQEVSGTSKLILENQNKNVHGLLKSVLNNSKAVEGVVISSTEVTKDLISAQNSFINESLVKMEESVVNCFKVLNSYVSQNVEMKLVHMNKKINILQNCLDKLISVSDFSSPEKIKPDISAYFEGEGRSLDGKTVVGDKKVEFIPEIKLDPKKLIFDEK